MPSYTVAVLSFENGDTGNKSYIKDYLLHRHVTKCDPSLQNGFKVVGKMNQCEGSDHTRFIIEMEEDDLPQILIDQQSKNGYIDIKLLDEEDIREVLSIEDASAFTQTQSCQTNSLYAVFSDFNKQYGNGKHVFGSPLITPEDAIMNVVTTSYDARDIKMLKLLLHLGGFKQKEMEPVLELACSIGKVDVVKEFFKAGMKPTMKCLYNACLGNHTLVIELLLNIGMELDEQAKLMLKLNYV